MVIKATWNGHKYVIPAEYKGIHICSSLHDQVPEILTNNSNATSLFMSFHNDLHTKENYNKIIAITHSAREYNENKRKHHLHTMMATIPIGDIKDRKKAIVIATIKFINRIIADEKRE